MSNQVVTMPITDYESAPTRSWYIALGSPATEESWRRWVEPWDRVMAVGVVGKDDVAPCLGLGASRHRDLINYLYKIGFKGESPYQIEIALNANKLVERVYTFKDYTVALEDFAQSALRLVPQLFRQGKVQLCRTYAVGNEPRWIKEIGKDVITYLYSQIPGRSKNDIAIFQDQDPFLETQSHAVQSLAVRGKCFHVQRKLYEFPRRLREFYLKIAKKSMTS